MIDNPDQAERLFTKLEAALPLPARVTPELAATLLVQNPASSIPSSCSIVWIRNVGDEGGIVCKLKFVAALENEAFVSITHLRFDARLPLAREITAYQKHRVKRLRRNPA